MPHIQNIIHFLQDFAPLHLAEDWDNVGLLLGNHGGETNRVMTCLTLTPDVAAEAIREKVDLIVSHHPILFRPIQRITTETNEGRMLLDLITAGIAVYSPHTAFDSAAAGINTQLAKRFDLKNVEPLRADDNAPLAAGSGRVGELETPLDFKSFLQNVLLVMKLPGCEAVATEREIHRVAVACGAAASFLSDAIEKDCDVFITGEARFHAALEARSAGIGLILLGHYASERFALETLATQLSETFSNLTCWASRQERDPLSYRSAQ